MRIEYRGSMKQYIFIFILIAFSINPLDCAGECLKCKNRISKDNVINDTPFIIKKPGRYQLESNVVLSPQNENGAAIIIKADHVTLDMKGHTLNMKDNGFTGIYVGPHTDIRIFNGKILNTGRPGPVPTTAPNANILKQEFPYQSPYALEPTRGVGIAMDSGAENVFIENMIFENNFIGIAGFDRVKRISIRHCKGIECGLKFPVHNIGNSYRRGGFIIIAPVEDSNEPVSQNIQISHCTAESDSAQFGIAIFHGKNVLVDDCVMSIKNVNQGMAYSESSAFSAISCHHVRFNNLVGYGGANCITTYNCADDKFTNCQALK